MRLAGQDQVVVTTRIMNTTPGSHACTSDLVADTSTVKVPGGLDATKPVIVKIDGTTLTLAPR